MRPGRAGRELGAISPADAAADYFLASLFLAIAFGARFCLLLLQEATAQRFQLRADAARCLAIRGYYDGLARDCHGASPGLARFGAIYALLCQAQVPGDDGQLGQASH